MEILLTVIFVLLGVAVGSFLNVCSDRLPGGKSPAYPPSHCDACKHSLSPKDLVPVFSYLRLRGRCRYCHATIPRRVFWLEIGTGLLFAFTYWHYGLNVEFAVITLYCCLFILILVIDLEHGLILNRVVYPAAIAILIISIFQPPTGAVAISLPWPLVAGGINGIANSLIGGILGFVALLIPAIVFRGGMGWGDVKMAALIGMTTGYPPVFVALFLGIVFGGLIAWVLLLLKIKKRKDPIPFGPFLSITTIITLFWGNDILNWYLGLF
ncbi:prepilin peptidase [Chloroflexota bacterium]